MYYRTWGQDIIERANKIRALEEGISEETDSDYVEPFMFRIFDKKPVAIIPLVLIPIILFTTFSFGTFNYIGPVEEEEEVIIPLIEVEDIGSASGYVNENSVYDVPVEISSEKLKWVNCTLTWTDELTQYFQGTNAPDELRITIIAPNGEESDTDSSTLGSVSASFQLPNYEDVDNFEEEYTGEWVLHVEAGNCGDDQGPLGFRVTPDNGNDWNLQYSYTYLEKEESP